MLVREKEKVLLRLSVCAVVAVVFGVGLMAAAQNPSQNRNPNQDKKYTKATITKVDADRGTVTLKLKKKDGTEEQKTFKLTGEVMLYDNNGKTVRLANVDIFRSGDEVLVIEREGQLREMRKDRSKIRNNNSGGR